MLKEFPVWWVGQQMGIPNYLEQKLETVEDTARAKAWKSVDVLEGSPSPKGSQVLGSTLLLHP